MIKRNLSRLLSLTMAFSLLAGYTKMQANAETLPPVDKTVYMDPSKPVDVRVKALMDQMTLDEKIGQMTQAERASSTADDVKNYSLGSILSGGGSLPTPNTAQGWADMTDNYQNGAKASRLGIPILYGVDAVHGHNNVYGATIFPHNIGIT
jgi:beta-glucosidase